MSTERLVQSLREAMSQLTPLSGPTCYVCTREQAAALPRECLPALASLTSLHSLPLYVEEDEVRVRARALQLLGEGERPAMLVAE